MKTQALVLFLLFFSLGTAAGADFVGNAATPFGTFRGVLFELHTGRFEGTTSLGFYSMPYEIVVPAAPHRGNRTLLIEPPHWFFVTAARDFVLGQQVEPMGAGLQGLRLPPDGVDLREVEAELVRQALERTTGNQTRAARLLALSRDQLRYRMDKLGLL